MSPTDVDEVPQEVRHRVRLLVGDEALGQDYRVVRGVDTEEQRQLHVDKPAQASERTKRTSEQTDSMQPNAPRNERAILFI